MENHYQRSSIGTSERDWSSEKIGVAPKNAPSTLTSIKRFLKIIINGGLTGVTRVHIGCKWQVTNNPFCHILTKIGKNPIIDDYKCYIKNFFRPLYKSWLSTNRTNKQINFNSCIEKSIKSTHILQNLFERKSTGSSDSIWVIFKIFRKNLIFGFI